MSDFTFYKTLDSVGYDLYREKDKTIEELKGRQLKNIKDAHLIVLLTALIKGEKTPAEVRKELDNLLGDHASSIATEYRQYIENAGVVYK